MTLDTAAEPAAPSRSADRARRFADAGGVLNAFSHGILAIWALLIVFPLLWVVLGSFKTDTQINGSAWSWPSHWTFDAFGEAWTKGIGGFFVNTAIVLAGSLTLTMLLGSMAAYVLARYPFPGNRAVYFLFVAGAMFPVYLALVPLFFMVRNLGRLSPLLGLNSYLGLILVYVAYSLPFTVFFMHAFFRTLPTAVHEAALLDGCSHTRAFFQVMVPTARPGLISVGIFNLLGQWNQYILPVTLMQPTRAGEADHSMLAQGLVNLALQAGYRSNVPQKALFAGMTIAMLPVLVVYLSFQRQVQSGLTSTTLK